MAGRDGKASAARPQARRNFRMFLLGSFRVPRPMVANRPELISGMVAPNQSLTRVERMLLVYPAAFRGNLVGHGTPEVHGGNAAATKT
jgi:hypothetical protein